MSDLPVEELLAQIQRHLEARRGVHSSDAAPASHGDRFSAAVYDALAEADAMLDTVRVDPFLSPPHLPLLGGAWQKVRKLAHDLVIYYVNRLAGAQGAFNREIVTALRGLVADLDRGGPANPDEKIAELQREIAALREQVAALRAQSAARLSDQP
ncbi:MAG: hypothetical protein ACP5UQ_06315 [Anaerolineae bacterium]